jgi:O-antigen/teichoic acid export membrane protein
MAPLMFLRTGPWVKPGPDDPKAPGMREMVRLGLPLFLATTFAVIYTKIDIIMLGQMVSESAAGLYGQGHQAFDTMLLVPGLLGTALFPAMARYGMNNAQDTVRLGERATRFMMAAILPLTLFITFVSGPVIAWFDPNPVWAPSVPVMQIVIWGLPLQAAATVLNRLLITANREKVFVVIGLVAMVTNIVLNAILIPRYSYFGASWATIFSLGVSFFLHVFYLNRTQYRTPLMKAMLGPVASCAAAWLATVGLIRLLAPGWHIAWNGLPLDQGWIPFIVSSLVMVVLYPAALIGLRTITPGDIRLLRELGG